MVFDVPLPVITIIKFGLSFIRLSTEGCMSKRNLVWLLAVTLLIMLFWHIPDSVNREQNFYKTFAPLTDIISQIKKNYVEDTDDRKLLEGAVQGMLQRLDPFCKYIPPDEMKSFNQQTNGTIQGIGIFPEERDGLLTILSPLEDSPAFKAGLLPGDQILSIDNETTRNMTWEDAAKRLAGPVGSIVTLKVRHEQTGKTETINIIRDTVHIISIKGYIRKPNGNWDYMIDPTAGIGYIRITSFLAGTVSELDSAYQQILRQNVQALILDLRFNPGGLLNTAVEVASRFLEKGIIVSTKGKFQQEGHWPATGENIYKPIPVVILVNEFSASAAEIVAGALKDHKRAKLIGVRTYGKGSVQKLIPLENGYGAIKITTDYYYLPSGKCIHRRPDSKVWGVAPDLCVPLSMEEELMIKESRKQADVFWGRMPASANTEKTTIKIPQPKPLFVDRQLSAALKTLRDQLNKKTTTQSRPNAPTTQTAIK